MRYEQRKRLELFCENFPFTKDVEDIRAVLSHADAIGRERDSFRAALESVRLRIAVLQTMCLGPPGLVNFLEETAAEIDQALKGAAP